MAVEYRNTDLYKVVSTRGRKSRYGGYASSTEPTSALLHNSKALVNYNSGRLFTPPTVPNTPIICFDDLAAAFEFADKFPGRTVWDAEAYGEFMPLTQVLKIKYRGWDAVLAQFWADVKAGNPLTGYTTITAQPHSVGVWGVLRLVTLATRPKVEAAAEPSVPVDTPFQA